MIIDCHTHIGKFNKKSWDPEELARSMEQAGIDTSLVIELVGNQKTIDVADLPKKFPQFKIVGGVKYKTIGEKQIAGIKNRIQEKRIVGVKLYLGYEHFYPADKKLHSLYNFCSQKEIPVIFHTGLLEKNCAGVLKYSHPLHIDELAFLFPKLNIVIAHFGNPWIRDCAAVVAKNKNVYADVSGYFTEYQKIQAHEVKDFVGDLLVFRSVAGNFSKLLFGTDWPIYSQKEYLKAVQSFPMSKEEKDLVFWKNAKNLFRL